MAGNVTNATIHLVMLVTEKGWEYPDAHAATVMKFDVDGDELSQMYDAYFRGE